MSYNVLYYNTSDSALVQYNSIDLAQLSEYVLELMAAGTYVGTINIGNTNPIGTFIDTVRVGGVGNSNTTILSNTYTLSQVNTVQSTVDSPMYVGVVTSGNTVTIQENATTLNDLADEIIQSLVSNYGVNSYYLGTSAPADGGTWVSRGSLLDTLQNFTVTNTEYRLWHKITSSTYTSYKAPLKIDGSSQLTQWSSTEVQRLIKKVEERIISTGIGTYALQTSAPANGTWSLAGTITDVRRGVDVDPGYTGVGNTYTATYQSETQPTYIGPTLSFISSYEGDSADVYTGVGLTSYTSLVTNNYESASPLLYTTSYQGADTSGEYARVGAFSSPNYTGIGPSYVSFISYKSDFYLANYDNSFIGTVAYYTGLPDVYTNETFPYDSSYDGEAFTNNPENSDGPYTATLTYFNPDFVNFVNVFFGDISYIGTISNFYDTEYTLENIQLYESTSFAAFLEEVNYTGSANYDREFLAITNYVGPNVTNNYDGTQFTDTGIYTGPSLVNSSTSIVSTVSLWKRIS